MHLNFLLHEEIPRNREKDHFLIPYLNSIKTDIVQRHALFPNYWPVKSLNYNHSQLI